MSIVAGIDVSKETLDVSLNGNSKSFKNSSSGYKSLAEYLKKGKVDLVLMEATGKYHETVATNLYLAKFSVVVINPARAHYYAKTLGRRSKTDHVDARVLSEFGSKHFDELIRYTPPSPEEREFMSLVRMRHDVVTMRATTKTRLKEPSLGDLELKLLEQQLHFYSEQIKEIEAQIKAILRASQHLARFQSAKQVAAYIGVCPCIRQSGSSLHSNGSISKTGNRVVRHILYLAAMAAICSKNIFQDMYIRLISKGKSKMQALVAVMHKMIRIAFRLIQNNVMFDPKHDLTANA